MLSPGTLNGWRYNLYQGPRAAAVAPCAAGAVAAARVSLGLGKRLLGERVVRFDTVGHASNYFRALRNGIDCLVPDRMWCALQPRTPSAMAALGNESFVYRDACRDTVMLIRRDAFVILLSTLSTDSLTQDRVLALAADKVVRSVAAA